MAPNNDVPREETPAVVLMCAPAARAGGVCSGARRTSGSAIPTSVAARAGHEVVSELTLRSEHSAGVGQAHLLPATSYNGGRK